MSWFGFGGGSADKGNDSNSSFDTPSPYQEESYDNHRDFAAPGQFSAPSGGSLEDQLMQEQQMVMVQQVMFKLTESAFEKCVSKPGSALSSSEQNCISSVVGKYLEAGEFMIKKIGSKGGAGGY
jgi:hypothetical protein